MGIELALMQADGGGGFFGSFIWIIMFILLSVLYPRMMVQQIILKLDNLHSNIQKMAVTAKGHVIKKLGKHPSKEVRESVNDFMEFFAIDPVSVDPFGIVRKIEFVSDLAEKRFKYFVKQIAPKMGEEHKSNLIMGLSGSIMLHQISKIVKHFIELIRKTKNIQLAMIIQLQMPFIERIVKALAKGTEAMTNGWPIGDTIGPLIAAELIGSSKAKDQADKDIIVCRKKLAGKNVIIVKARGPGVRLGKLGRSVENMVRREKLSKIITIDASAKLEGEKTGTIAEGVGVAIGGTGVDKSQIENLAVEKDVPLDTIIVKMSSEEAMMPMRKEILNSITRVIGLVEKRIAETTGGGSVLIMGVGNTCGVGNDGKDAENAKVDIKKTLDMLKKRGDFDEELKKKGFLSEWFG